MFLYGETSFCKVREQIILKKPLLDGKQNPGEKKSQHKLQFVTRAPN